MGKEYRISLANADDNLLNMMEFEKFSSFWKIDDKHGNYYLGRIGESDWPEVMVWKKNNSIGITVNDGAGTAWRELVESVARLKRQRPDFAVSISDWDTDEDLSADFSPLQL